MKHYRNIFAFLLLFPLLHCAQQKDDDPAGIDSGTAQEAEIGLNAHEPLALPLDSITPNTPRSVQWTTIGGQEVLALGFQEMGSIVAYDLDTKKTVAFPAMGRTVYSRIAGHGSTIGIRWLYLTNGNPSWPTERGTFTGLSI